MRTGPGAVIVCLVRSGRVADTSGRRRDMTSCVGKRFATPIWNNELIYLLKADTSWSNCMAVRLAKKFIRAFKEYYSAVCPGLNISPLPIWPHHWRISLSALVAHPGASSVQDRHPGVQSLALTRAAIPRTTQSHRCIAWHICSAGISRLVVPSGCQLSPTVPFRLLPHVRGTTCLRMSRLLSRCSHSASHWKPICFWSHFPDISRIFNWPFWTLANLFQGTKQYLGHSKTSSLIGWLIKT